MTSNILTIKCPQCGSIKHISLGNEKYKCEGCGAVYFVDKKDIHIFHHQQSQQSQQPNMVQPNKTIIWGVIAFSCVVFLLVMIESFIDGNNSNSKGSVVGHSSYSSTNNNRPKPTQEAITKEWSNNIIDMYVFKGKPYLIFKTELSLSKRASRSQYQHFIRIYDIEANKIVGQFELPTDKKDPFSRPHPYELVKWEDDDFMLLIDNQKLYQLNKYNNTFESVNKELFSKQAEFSSGLAEIKFVSEDYGSGLYVYTNKGKHFYYYPKIDKIYNDSEYYKARSGQTPLPSNFSVRTGFSFSTKSNDYPDEIPRLIKYEYQFLPGYPREDVWFKWTNVYYTKQNQAIVVIDNNTPYEKILLEPWRKKASRTLKYLDFTPDRVYFFPRILDYNADSVLIGFSTSPVNKDKYIIQLLDAKTGDIRWSYNFPLEYYKLGAKILDNRIILRTENKFILLDSDGKQNSISDIKTLE